MSKTIKDELRAHIADNCWKPHPLVIDAADYIEDLERQLAELRQPTAQQVEDAASSLATSLSVIVENGGIGPEDMFDDAREALAKYAALQAGKEKEHGN